MPTTCLDIIVNIQDYDPTIVYHLFIKDKGSAIIPTTYVIAPGPQYVFRDMPVADYEVGIRVVCEGGTLSPIVWEVPADASCVKAILSRNTAGIVVSLPNASVAGFEWRADYLDWIFVPGGGTALHSLVFADIDVVLGGYIADRPASIIDFQVRVKCGTGMFSEVAHLYDVATNTSIGQVTLLKNFCEGTRWVGMALRISICGNTFNTESLIYDAGGPEEATLSQEHARTNNMDTDIAYYKALMNGSNSIRVSFPGNPASAMQVSTDFISTISPLGSGVPGPVPCGEYICKYTITFP